MYPSSNCDLALDIERQALFGATHKKVHVATHRPEEVLAGAKTLVFLLVKYAALDQFIRLTHAINVFCNPE